MMKIVVTGSSGRVGRSIYRNLSGEHEVVGFDRSPSSTTHIVGDILDKRKLREAIDGADAIIHAAALHAPHVPYFSESEFERINVEGTAKLADLAKTNNVRHFILTSTTALYGHAIKEKSCTWVDEDTIPQPKNIYHATKLEAEDLLEHLASDEFNVRVLRMSRCFPEPADKMTAYRLHRGIDARDVAKAHELALRYRGSSFERFVVSGRTPFDPSDCERLKSDARVAICDRARPLAQAFNERGWELPTSIDRVYSSKKAEKFLGWKSSFGYEEVLSQLDRCSAEVLPLQANIAERIE